MSLGNSKHSELSLIQLILARALNPPKTPELAKAERAFAKLKFHDATDSDCETRTVESELTKLPESVEEVLQDLDIPRPELEKIKAKLVKAPRAASAPFRRAHLAAPGDLSTLMFGEIGRKTLSEHRVEVSCYTFTMSFTKVTKKSRAHLWKIPLPWKQGVPINLTEADLTVMEPVLFRMAAEKAHHFYGRS